ncbi:dihydroxyacetone kinase subunit L [Trueperella pyogenes]|uniref:dihydroxyacetone kinase subunit L n=1 Tax=Trueperella pyogenes TaxID=1661 RepID=UPI0004696D7B|nr:dihydroxyacetone kinase subunit L [Trueperella pyogenes]UVJ57601.1 DAK2 domain-containing protein [Trueperella pyogenes]
MDNAKIARAIHEISTLMRLNRDYLIELDQVNGDGDLGISMDDGFRALDEYYSGTVAKDLGQSLRGAAKVLNSAAPSSLGTILSFGLMGMAKALRGKEAATFEDTVAALEAGLENIEVKAGSSPGQKTIVDAFTPAVDTLKSGDFAQPEAAFEAAAKAAADGSESTKHMVAVHGRAAFTAARSLGVLDGGSVVGKLIFEGIALSAKR